MKRYALCFLSLAIAPIVAAQEAPFVERQVPRGSSLRASIDVEPNLIKAAELLLTAVFTKCGDSKFLLARDQSGNIRLFEFKPEFQREVIGGEAGRIDRMNGIEATGEYTFIPTTLRWIDNGVAMGGIPAHRPHWTTWSGRLTLGNVRLSLERRSGHWTITGDIPGALGVDNFSDEAIRNKITCDAALTQNPFAATASNSSSLPQRGPVTEDDPAPVSGAVQATKLISGPAPVYPSLARGARIQGVVRFNAIIDKAGKVQDVKVISGHPLLVKAAQDAVRQWEYKPTLSSVTGKPVSVATTIDVEFKP